MLGICVSKVRYTISYTSGPGHSTPNTAPTSHFWPPTGSHSLLSWQILLAVSQQPCKDCSQPVRETLKHCGDHTITQAGRGENQSVNNQQDIQQKGPHLAEGKTKEKSLRSPTASEPYYTMLDYSQGHHLVHTNPALHRYLSNPGCSYVSCFTGALT